MRRVILVVILMTALLSDAAPFWREKVKIFQKIVQDRAVIVSVKNEAVVGGNKILIMQAGMKVSKANDSVFITSQKYENLPKISDYIQVAKWDKNKNQLYIVAEAYKYQARMNLQMDIENSDSVKKMKFVVIDGHFKGMTGAITFEPYDKGKSSIMGYHAFYEYQKLPIPEFFIEFGIEVVLQKVGGLMRRFLEKEPAI